MKVFADTEHSYYMDEILCSNLEIARKMISKDFDFIAVIDGSEGSGKSVLAQQIARYLDSSFSIDRITFTPEDFREQVLTAPPKSCIILDEAFGSLSARQSMTLTNRSIVDMLCEIRQKNLYILIVLPSIFDLDRYVSLWRSRCLIHVYLSGIQRGYFTFFSADAKKKLIVYGRKTYNYSCVKSDFKGRFTNYYTVSESEYRQKKIDSLRSLKQQDKRSDKDMCKDLISSLKQNGMSIPEIYTIWKEHGGYAPTERTLYYWVQNAI